MNRLLSLIADRYRFNYPPQTLSTTAPLTVLLWALTFSGAAPQDPRMPAWQGFEEPYAHSPTVMGTGQPPKTVQEARRNYEKEGLWPEGEALLRDVESHALATPKQYRPACRRIQLFFEKYAPVADPNGQDLARVDMVLMGVAQPFISARPAAVEDYESGSLQLYRNARADGIAV